jgi:VanZ family protein
MINDQNNKRKRQIGLEFEICYLELVPQKVRDKFWNLVHVICYFIGPLVMYRGQSSAVRGHIFLDSWLLVLVSFYSVLLEPYEILQYFESPFL